MNVGDTAPDFVLVDQDGREHRLSTLLAEGPVVLFWYPVAGSTGCTKEACHFRDLAGEFAKHGAHRIGISTDTVEEQKRFSDRDGLDYPLLADPDGAVADLFGVRRRGLLAKLGPTKRVTFVIGTDQRIREVIRGELRFSEHADKALAALASD